MKVIMSKLVKTAKEYDLALDEVRAKHSFQTHKMYYKKIKNRTNESFYSLDIKACEIINRYYRRNLK